MEKSKNADNMKDKAKGKSNEMVGKGIGNEKMEAKGKSQSTKADKNKKEGK